MPACGSKFVSRRSKSPQWLRVDSFGRLRSCRHMPSLVGDSGQVLGVLGWALTRIRNLLLAALPDKFSNCSCKKLFQVHKMFINLELKQSATI